MLRGRDLDLSPFEMKAEIERRLDARSVWELDKKLPGIDYLTGLEKALLSGPTILEGHIRYAPMPLQDRNYRPEPKKKTNPNQDAAEGRGAWRCLWRI